MSGLTISIELDTQAEINGMAGIMRLALVAAETYGASSHPELIKLANKILTQLEPMVTKGGRDSD